MIQNIKEHDYFPTCVVNTICIGTLRSEELEKLSLQLGCYSQQIKIQYLGQTYAKKKFIDMKFKFNCISCILTGNLRLGIHFNETLSLGDGKGTDILFQENQSITKDTKGMMLCLKDSEKKC